jgi:hypothetical protein
MLANDHAQFTRVVKSVEHIEITLARNAKHPFDAVDAQAFDENAAAGAKLNSLLAAFGGPFNRRFRALRHKLPTSWLEFQVETRLQSEPDRGEPGCDHKGCGLYRTAPAYSIPLEISAACTTNPSLLFS